MLAEVGVERGSGGNVSILSTETFEFDLFELGFVFELFDLE